MRFVSFLSPQMHAVYAAMVEYVGRSVGAEATLSVGSHDYDVFASGEADFGFI